MVVERNAAIEKATQQLNPEGGVQAFDIKIHLNDPESQKR